MTRDEKIKTEILTIWFILIGTEDCYNYSKYLYDPATQEERDYLNKSSAFQFMRRNLWSLTVIELSKLFSDSKNHHFNIHTFINKLKNDSDFYHPNINTKMITDWENQISDNHDLITNIKTLRDKFYAHTDRDREKYQFIDLKFLEIEQLIQIIKSIIKEIYDKVFESEAIIESPTFDRSSFNIVNILVNEEKMRIQKITEEFHKNRTIFK